jgi:DNA polymerase (family 10)
MIPPELREGEAEFRAIMAGGLPKLIEANDILGDLQTQTEWSDGRHSIDAMVARAQELGYAYLAITDHSQGLGIANGLDPDRLAEQGRYIDALDATTGDFRVLKGSEVNIEKDGQLDLPDEALRKLDFVGAAIHSHFDLDRDAMTRRIVRAIEHPAVDVYFHPTTRVLGRRAPIDFDLDAVMAAALRTGTALEIDAFAPRLDLSAAHIERAIAAGVALMLDSDAHRVEQLDYSRDLGVPLARRGGATAGHVVNTRPRAEFEAWLADRRRSAGW